MKRYFLLLIVLLLAGCTCPEITHEITTIPMLIEPSSVNVTVIPAQVIVVSETEYQSAYIGKEHLIRDGVLRVIYNSDRCSWLRESIDVTYTGDGVWEIRVKYNNGRIEYFTYDEDFGWS